MKPKISICMPNLNNRQFLPARLESIREQSCAEWELVVVDAYSSDGSWDYLLEKSRNEPRMRLYQIPPSGIYAGLNDCIRRGQGEYIYVATSDDVMAPDCLEK